MGELDILSKLSDAGLVVLFALTLLAMVLRAPNIIGEITRLVQTWNVGQKERSDAIAELQTQTIKSANDAFEKAMSAVTEAMAESRRYYVEQLQSAMKGNQLLEQKVQGVEDENEELRSEVKVLREEIKNLREENVQLRKDLNAKTKRSSRSAGRAAADK